MGDKAFESTLERKVHYGLDFEDPCMKLRTMGKGKETVSRNRITAETSTILNSRFFFTSGKKGSRNEFRNGMEVFHEHWERKGRNPCHPGRGNGSRVFLGLDGKRILQDFDSIDHLPKMHSTQVKSVQLKPWLT